MRHQAKNSEFHLRPDELRRLIEGTQSLRDRVILELFVYTGLRRAELRSIRASDVDFSRHRLLIRRGKGDKQRIVYLPENIMTNLRNYCGERRDGPLFTGRGSSPMSLRNINYVVARAAKNAGVETPNPRYQNVGPHLLRHSFARNWKRAGGSLESLQKILGHHSLKTTLDIYGTESQAEVEENYKSIAAQLALGT